jgi:hypothetical protein
MSNQQHHHEDVPRFEPWLRVMFASLFPAAAASYAPPSFLVPLLVVTVGLFVGGLIMLRRQSMQRRRQPRPRASLQPVVEKST